MMTTQKIGAALLMACCGLAGCATPGPVDRTGAGDRQAQDDTSSPGEPGPLHGEVERIEERWPDGNLRYQREVVRDKEGQPISHGLTTRWWQDGQKKSEMEFVNGVRHGRRIAWHNNGQPWSEGAYDNGRPTGTWTAWNEDGSIERQWHYDENGAYHGMFTLWYDNGGKKMEIEFVHGLRQGFETSWDEAGNIVLEIDYGRDES